MYKRTLSFAIVFVCGLLTQVGRPAVARENGHDDAEGRHSRPERTLYVWAGDQARVSPDFLAVIDFDSRSPNYGRVLRTVPVPPPGNVGNEPHHCHLSADGNVLACGGLLSLLRDQNGIYFFDVRDARHPRFLFSTRAAQSSIADDFLPLAKGGFLLTSMGSAAGDAPGRLVEIDRRLRVTHEWPDNPPSDGFNPHGIDARPEMNLLVTSDFVNPVSTLDAFSGDMEFRGAVRVWDMARREIVRTVQIPEAIGTMDVKLIPGDPLGRAFTVGMFDGHVYLVDTANGTALPVFDCETIVPHVEVPVPGGMTQLLQINKSGDRLFFGLFQAGQVGMLDVSDPEHPVQQAIVSLGVDAGPHDIDLSEDGSRLVVTDYFLNEDGFGKVHAEGDHKVHVVNVTHDTMTLDPRFEIDFNTAFATGPARPHGIAMK